MAAKVLLVTLLAAAACLSAAQIPKEAPYNTVAAAANPENYKGYSSWPLTIKELLSNAACATDDTIFNLDFIECNLWFIEELASGKPAVSKVHCSKDCATQWGKISRACYNAFRAHLTSKRTFAAEAKEFFAECDAVVPKLEFEEEKPKVARGVNFASAKGQQVNAASLAPQGRVNAKQVEEPVPIAETAEEMPVVDEVAEDVGFVADELPADLTEEIPLVDAFGTEFVVPKTALDAINQTSPMLLELIQDAGLEAALGPLFKGTVFAPTDEALTALTEAAASVNITLTPELLKDVLTYHVSADFLPISVLNGTEEITTLKEGAPALKVLAVVDPAFPDFPTIDIVSPGSVAFILGEEVQTETEDATVYSVDNVLLPENGPLAAALSAVNGRAIPGAEAPEPLPTEPVVAGAAANLASAAALAAALLAAALLM